MYAIRSYYEARECDPVSAYGGVIGFNRAVNGETAREVASSFFEAVVAPSYDREARKILSAKANLRLLETGGHFRWSGEPGHEMKKVSGGLLLQGKDRHVLDPASLKVVTKRAPTEEESVITSYSIHYTKLYDTVRRETRSLRRYYPDQVRRVARASRGLSAKSTPGGFVYIHDSSPHRFLSIACVPEGRPPLLYLTGGIK